MYRFKRYTTAATQISSDHHSAPSIRLLRFHSDSAATMGRTGGKVAKGSLGSALLKTQKKSSATSTTDIASSAGKHVSARDGGDAAVALASYLEGSSLVRNNTGAGCDGCPRIAACIGWS